MRRLGHFLHIARSGVMIVKLSIKRPPRIGTRVLGPDGRIIGKVVDIIGPVRGPYAVVKPVRRDLKLSRGTTLFMR